MSSCGRPNRSLSFPRARNRGGRGPSRLEAYPEWTDAFLVANPGRSSTKLSIRVDRFSLTMDVVLRGPFPMSMRRWPTRRSPRLGRSERDGARDEARHEGASGDLSAGRQAGSQVHAGRPGPARTRVLRAEARAHRSDAARQLRHERPSGLTVPRVVHRGPYPGDHAGDL